MRHRKNINDGISGEDRLTHTEVKDQTDHYFQTNQRISTNDMTITHEKPKGQPNTLCKIRGFHGGDYEG
jgi:hypothetical protein